jgi:hypothetical protein
LAKYLILLKRSFIIKCIFVRCMLICIILELSHIWISGWWDLVAWMYHNLVIHSDTHEMIDNAAMSILIHIFTSTCGRHLWKDVQGTSWGAELLVCRISIYLSIYLSIYMLVFMRTDR